MVNESPNVEEILSTVRAAAKRVTAAKRTVAEVLVAARDHLTADEITRRVQDVRPEVSPSTVYRILEEFDNLQIVVHSHLGQQAALYHLAGPVHGHLICDVCGHTVEIPARHFNALSKDLQRSYGFALDRHHVAVSGTCSACRPRH